jgi:hypothetical protein
VGAGRLEEQPRLGQTETDVAGQVSNRKELLIVPEVRDKLLDGWGIDAGVHVGEFSREQNAYLDYHRVNVFKHGLLER